MLQDQHYIIYCDESDDKGRFCSNFYAGALIAASRRQAIEHALNQVKSDENIFGEVKWTKISDAYEGKYIRFIERFFDFIKDDEVKFQLVFTQNIYVPINLTKEQIEAEYFILYYQFIKNAFGRAHCNRGGLPKVLLSVYLDNVPGTTQNFERFRRYLSQLSDFPEFYSTTLQCRQQK